MPVHADAGKPVKPIDRINIGRLVSDYFLKTPNSNIIEQRVTFGTSGHRGCASLLSFNEYHILAICQAIAEFRLKEGYQGPLFLGKDTHALSEPAFASALSVLIANGISVIIQDDDGFTPTPVISRLIIHHNQKQGSLADGLIITPSHNPPSDGGIKYNPPHGGPAEGEITQGIEQRANELITAKLVGVKRATSTEVAESTLLSKQDFIEFYASQLSQVIDMESIAKSGLSIGVDPLGGSGIHYWPVIAKKYDINIDIVNPVVDASFSFMPLDKDGKIRMDCSSPYAMSDLVTMKDRFDISIGNDPDFDRHGIVTQGGGLMNPNHYLATAIHYLLNHREWRKQCQIGKTLVSSSLIDRVVDYNGRSLAEVPVGFKWFVDGLQSSHYAFAGEESAGATFLARDGSCWTTDKDGFIMGLLAAEILAVTGKDPFQIYQELIAELGEPYYARVDTPANFAQREVLKNLSNDSISSKALAGEAIETIHSHAPGNCAAIGGIKVVTANGWFAARPSGTENIYKIYAESFISAEHVERIIVEAKAIVSNAMKSAV